MQKVRAAIVLMVCAALLAGCAYPVQTLVDNDALRVVREGRYMRLYDLAGEAEYNLVILRRKRSEGPISPHTLIETPTIKVDGIAGGIEVTSSGTVYRITQK